MKGGDPRRWLRGAVIGVAAGIVALAAVHPPLAETFENRTFDLRSRLFADARRADQGIVAVVIDQKSLDLVSKSKDEGGLQWGWPWPRDFHGMLVRYLTAAGARAVVFDLVFSEPSVYTRGGFAEDDVAFAADTKGKRVVQSIMLTRESGTTPDRAWPPGLRDAPLTRRLAAAPGDAFDKATPPISELTTSSAAVGWIGFNPDDDGVARALRPAVTYAPAGAKDALEVWALPLAAASVAGARVELAGEGHKRTLRVNGRAIPLDEDGQMVLRFHGGEGVYRQYTYAEVLRSSMKADAGAPVTVARPEEFRDKIVLVGATAAGLLDLRATPMKAFLPGYVIHAVALDNLLNGDPIRRATVVTRATIVLALAVGCGALAMARATRIGLGGIVAVALLYLGAAAWAFGGWRFWLDVVGPSLAMALAWAGSTGYAYVTEGRERRFLRDAFSRYLAPDVVTQLITQPGRLTLGGEKRELTVMFADVAGFTTLSEGRDPAEVVTLMNECFEQLTGVIQREGGTVDKFIGDAVMAFWNAPVEQPDHAARALRAARELLAAVARLNAAWDSRGLPKLGMRVGIATGPAVVGNVGSHTKFNYTVMGDTVNLASRVEGAAKVCHTASLITDGTATAAAGAVPLRELDWLVVKGRGEFVPVYEVLLDDAHAPEARAEMLGLYAKGLELYRGRAFEEAAAQFEAALAIAPEDGPSTEMLERCREYIAPPPPADWRGDHVLTSK
jgi:adenylate cyclase